MGKAKIGDLIRIVEPMFSEDPYKKGGIHEVVIDDYACGSSVGILVDSKITEVDDSEYVIHRKAGEEGAEGTTIIKDAINPQHYKQGRVEVIDIIEDAVQGADPFEAVLQANIIKYTQRYRNKNGVEDLKKAQWYLNKLISHLNDQK